MSHVTAIEDAAGTRSVREAVCEALGAGLRRAIDAGALKVEDAASVPAVEVSRPSNPEHGDLASNLALKLARPLRRPPMAIAEAVAVAVRKSTANGGPIAAVEAVPPGFLNVRLDPVFLEKQVDAVRLAGPRFGHLSRPAARSVNVEFVSANPTGPLTIGNARGAFVGDLLSRVLEAAGDTVTREYYFNDFNAQITNLGASVLAVRDGRPVPPDGYHGAYVGDLADALPPDVLAEALEAGERAADVVGAWASEEVRRAIEASLETLGVRFDVWRTEGSLHSEGWVARALARLREGGHVYEQDGAVWFRSTTFGDDKDRVIFRADGRPTYFAADIGYVLEKLSRGFDRLIYIWGADHHGTVARLRNAAQAMGFDVERVEVLLIAWVRFIRDGREIPMSKRSGEFVTLDELLDEIGVDAARWYFAARSHTTGIDFDIEAAKDPTASNPVHYVRYAHARIASILRRASDEGLTPATSVAGALSDDSVSADLAKVLLRLPEVVEDAADARELVGVTAYATELATTFHGFYRDRRVVDAADPETSARRLALVDAARQALANTLGLLGISAPDSM